MAQAVSDLVCELLEGGLAVHKKAGPRGDARARRTLSVTPAPIVMELPDRIVRSPELMGGKPCVRGTRVTVGTVVGLFASGHSAEAILEAYPYLERADLDAALAYAAWRVEEVEVPLRTS